MGLRRVIMRGAPLLAVACLVGLTVSGSISGAKPARKASAPATHLVVVPASAQGRAALASASVRTIARYRAFTLVEATGSDVARLVAAGGELRDDMRRVRIGRTTSDPSLARASLSDPTGRVATGTGPTGLAVVQYVGPLKDSWIDAVDATGVEIVSYMAENGQLVSGDDAALERLAGLLGRTPFVRAVTPFTAGDKQAPGLIRSGRSEVVVSTVAGKAGASARAAVADLSERRGAPVEVAGIVQQRVALDGADTAGLAELGGVVAIEPFAAPVPLDERAARIVDGSLNSSFQPVLGAGHLAFLAAKHLTSTSGIVDITDTGVDKGIVPVPAGSHPDLYVGGNPANASRIAYAQEATAADADAKDCGGHGTSLASVIAGYNTATGPTVEDAQGFNYGMGVQPYARIGATKIFNCIGNFDVTTSFSALHSAAYAAGARISNNSWGANTGGAYTAFSQEFDALVRDAQPGVAGNQQLIEVVAAGNAGAGANTITAPGTAKNVITVGASEGVRAIGGTDGCGVTDLQADNARDIVGFSSRGPTDDARIKPDVVAPGTHLSGAQPQVGASYDGTGVCNSQFPPGSLLYTLTSGTTHSTPHAAAFALLLRSWYHSGPGRGKPYPSPAMTKALMVNTATDLAGGNNGAGGTTAAVPNQIEGWGRINLAPVLNGTKRKVFDQVQTFSASGASKTRYFKIDARSRPLRVTLAWTDAPGPTIGSSYVNNLDLEVTVGGTTYKGNVLTNGRSVAGGIADPANNVESVFLPSGRTGAVRVKVIARNIAGDGVPGAGDATDQDYALLVSNAQNPDGPLLDFIQTRISPKGDGDARLEPGEAFWVRSKLKNVGTGRARLITGKLTAAAAGAVVTKAKSTWRDLRAGRSAFNRTPFKARAKSSLACGASVKGTVRVTWKGGAATSPYAMQTGAPGGAPATTASTDVPKAIPDNAPGGVSSTNAVSTTGLVSDLNVTIGQITHTFDADLVIDLTSPAGTTVRLVNMRGGSGDNFTNTVFDDEAATSISAGVAPFTGSFRPEQPLSAFDGQRASGTWTLKVVDTAAIDTGTLSSWDLTTVGFTCS